MIGEMISRLNQNLGRGSKWILLIPGGTRHRHAPGGAGHVTLQKRGVVARTDSFAHHYPCLCRNPGYSGQERHNKSNGYFSSHRYAVKSTVTPMAVSSSIR